MTMVIKKSNKSLQNAINDTQLELYKDTPIDDMLKQIEKFLLTNTVTIRPNRKSNPRLDKDAKKSTIATNSINYLKRKKKNVGN
jgi:hypothetical protein